GARVIEIDAPEQALRPYGLEVVAKVIETERTDPIRPSEPAPLPALVPAPPRRRDRVVAFGVAGVAVFFVGWLVVDAVAWVSTAFERGPTLGTLAAVAVAAGGGGGRGGGGAGARGAVRGEGRGGRPRRAWRRRRVRRGA